MSGPYTEGWPKKRPISLDQDELEGRWVADNLLDVIPLSDAERMREALIDIWSKPWSFDPREIARRALNPENK